MPPTGQRTFPVGTALGPRDCEAPGLCGVRVCFSVAGLRSFLLPLERQAVIWGLVSSPLASLVAQTVKSLPAMQETRVQSLGQEDPLEKEMATHPSILAWKIPHSLVFCPFYKVMIMVDNQEESKKGKMTIICAYV